MKKSFDINFHALRGPLSRMLGVMLMASLAIGASLYLRNTMGDEKRALDDRLQALVQDYQALVKAERIIETLYGRYQALEKQGFIGDEPRLRWLETLRRKGEESGIMAMQYRLHEQQAYPGPPSLDSGPYQLYVSTMDLQVDALHEGDLLLFLDRLYDQENGLLAVEGCTLQRQGGDELLSGQANVRADCKLSWFTIRPQGDEEASSGEFM